MLAVDLYLDKGYGVFPVPLMVSPDQDAFTMQFASWNQDKTLVFNSFGFYIKITNTKEGAELSFMKEGQTAFKMFCCFAPEQSSKLITKVNEFRSLSRDDKPIPVPSYFQWIVLVAMYPVLNGLEYTRMMEIIPAIYSAANHEWEEYLASLKMSSRTVDDILKADMSMLSSSITQEDCECIPNESFLKIILPVDPDIDELDNYLQGSLSYGVCIKDMIPFFIISYCDVELNLALPVNLLQLDDDLRGKWLLSMCETITLDLVATYDKSIRLGSRTFNVLSEVATGIRDTCRHQLLWFADDEQVSAAALIFQSYHPVKEMMDSAVMTVA